MEVSYALKTRPRFYVIISNDTRNKNNQGNGKYYPKNDGTQ